MPYGVTPEGFVLKRLVDIKTDYVTALESVYDPSTGEYLTVNLTDENDPLVQLVNATADALAELWEQLEICHNQFDPLKSIGAGLSGLVQLNAIRRLAGTATTDVFTCTGTIGASIPAGQRVTDSSQNTIFVLPEFTFDGAGEAEVVGVCSEQGPVDPAVGTFVQILTPVANWSSVVNIGPAVIGTSEETDSNLRYRQQRSTSNTGASLVDTLFSAIASIDGVSFCRIYQNRTLVQDARGIPGKTVAAVVVGGSDALITDELFNRIPLGADTFGTTTVTKTDVLGTSYDVKFTRPAAVPIFIEISISVTQAYLWSAGSGVAAIKANILQYAAEGASSLGVDSGFDQNGYVPGDSVYASELYVPVLKQSGIRINTIKIDIHAVPLEDAVAIAWDEIAEFSSDNISVVVV